jgi:hypothetical protein
METEHFLALLVYSLSAIIAVLTVFVIVLAIRVKRSTKLIDTFYGGSEVASFEKTILEHITFAKKIDRDLQELVNFSNKIYTLSSKAPYKMGLVRFNPFGDVGGNQSFAVAFLDREKTGIVISSLYGREGTRLYAKPVQNGKSLKGYGFSKEEQDAIEKSSSKKIEGFEEKPDA